MKRSLLFILIFIVYDLSAQSEYKFTKGLAAPECHRYGREALVTDQVAYQLYTNKFRQPAEGAKLSTANQGKEIVWKSIEVDSTGKFRGELLTNGYIYLTYESDQTKNALLNVTGNGMAYFNGTPHGGDIYGDGWMNIPVTLKKGRNEILIRAGNFSRWQGISAKLIFTQKSIALSVDDPTLPHIVLGKSSGNLFGAVVIVNNTDNNLKGLSLQSTLNGKTVATDLPTIPANSIRKVKFVFDPSGVSAKGDFTATLTLLQREKILDEKQLTISAVNELEHQSHTFISGIDGSVQYFGVSPPTSSLKNPALFLSVHGAGVQAIGQARAYSAKDWGVLVAPTNRRPRGFNWEDWGRMDALEVFDIAKKLYQPDPQKIFLTGHSMGGHGTWYLGATYPDKWAAIAPCAGYPTLTGYGSADGKIPEQGRTAEEQTLLRASNQSNVIELATNYQDLGVYIHHGDDDRVVSVNYARQMRKLLSDFHGDYSYYEYPGGSHWFGNESVDWPPLFEFFKWHKIEHDSTFDNIEFTTANPAISSQYRWASIEQQQTPLAYSKFQLQRDEKKLTISGITENVAVLRINAAFAKAGETVLIKLDSFEIKAVAPKDAELWLGGAPNWKVISPLNATQKNPSRSGPFKEAFNHTMIFIYGTKGTKEENAWSYAKARYDAEVWYYRGNGAVDMIADTEFAAEKYKDRGIVLFGNAATNGAWNKLLADCPINVTGDKIALGKQVFSGNDLGAYFTWPRKDNDVTMIAVVTGTGLAGMKATDPNQYFAAGSGFPDYLIFSADMLRQGAKGIKAAGFFTNDWTLHENK